MPLFTYIVRTDEGRNKGILTEDFTRNGTRVLDETKNSFGLRARDGREQAPEGLHRDVYDALDGRVHPEAFRHMIGFAFDREVLVDFDDVAFPSDDEIQAYQNLVDSMVVVIPNDL